jgi:hypothetical protein
LIHLRATTRRALPALIIATVLFPTGVSASPRAEESPGHLRESLRQSTIRAIELEIDELTAKLQAVGGTDGSAETKAALQRKIESLAADRERFASMPAGEYPDPVAAVRDAASVLDGATAYGPMMPAVPREAVVVVTTPYGDGSLLEVEGTSKSGPFFHLAGVRGGDPATLVKGKRYRVTLYLVYRREYFGFIGDYYVYVTDIR